MRKTSLFLVFLLAFACGGNSKNVDRGSGSDDGSDGGKGGSAGGKGAASGTGGSSTGATGGSIEKGGTGGSVIEGGAPSEPTGGVGGKAGSAGTDPTGGTSGAGAMPSITSCTEEFPFVGEWEGSVLDFYFEPLEDLRLVVVANEELGGYEGTFTWGSGDPPPPVTSADEPYPPGFWEEAVDVDGLATIEPWPGFPYSVVRGAGCDDTFRVSISAAEMWDEWCSLQTPIFTEGHGWACTLQGGGSTNRTTCTVQDGRGNSETYPVWRCAACGAFDLAGVCQCDEAGCSANREPTHTFDLELGTSGGVDVLSGPDPRCGDCTVRLERVE